MPFTSSTIEGKTWELVFFLRHHARAGLFTTVQIRRKCVLVNYGVKRNGSDLELSEFLVELIAQLRRMTALKQVVIPRLTMGQKQQRLNDVFLSKIKAEFGAGKTFKHLEITMQD